MNKTKFLKVLFLHRISGEENYFYIKLVRINNSVHKFGYDFCIEQNTGPAQVFYSLQVFRASDF